MVDFRGSDTAEALSRAVRNRLILQFGCPGATIPSGGLPSEPNSFDLWATADVSTFIASAPTAVRAPLNDYFAAQDLADTACNSNRADWTAATRTALAALIRVERAVGTTPDNARSMGPIGAEANDVTVTTTDMVAMYDRVYAALNRVTDMQSSDLWFSATHYAHLRGQRDLLASGAAAPEIVIFGDSVAARGIDSASVGSTLGRPVVNYGQFSAYPEGIAEFAPQVLTSSDAETIVWVLYPHQIYTRGCEQQQRLAIDPFRDPIALQELVFRPVSWLRFVDTADLLFGRYGGGRNYGGTQLQHKADDLHAPWITRAGAPFVHVGTDTDRIANQMTQAAGRYSDPQPCQARYDVIERVFGELRSQSHKIVVVVPPTSERVAGMHPNGWAGHESVVADLKGIADRTGADFLDLSRTVPEDHFHDLLHMNSLGREKFSAELATFLAG